ncbi:hypothetical protein EMIT091MI3_130093 [Kosakonia quasisacchari]
MPFISLNEVININKLPVIFVLINKIKNPKNKYGLSARPKLYT